MEQRINIEQTHPEIYKALIGLSGSINKSTLTPIQKELIKLRASQINSCAFCLDMHSKEALRIGETPQRIFVLNAWRETDLFTEEEKALLALTEEVTLITNKVTDATYQQAIQLLGEEYTAQAIMAITIINAWNRIVVATHVMPALS